MTEIICISATSKDRASKETVARLLKVELEHANKRVLIARIADPLKHICRKWFGWDGRMDDTGRSFLQYVGTDIVRARQPNFWLDFTLNLLAMMGDEWDYVLIPDCRYPNELDMERYGFQPRHIRIGNTRGLSNTPPVFAYVNNTSPIQLHSDIADIAIRLTNG